MNWTCARSGSIREAPAASSEGLSISAEIARRQERKAQEEAGQTPKGRDPLEPATGPRPKDQYNSTELEWTLVSTADNLKRLHRMGGRG